MPGILKCGMTMRTPPERLKEANHSDTWRPPTPFLIEFAKKVADPLAKEHMVHRQLRRIHPRREFFLATVEEVRRIFDTIDGKMWVNITCPIIPLTIPYMSKRKTIHQKNTRTYTYICDRCGIESDNIKEHLTLQPPCEPVLYNISQKEMRETYFSVYFDVPFQCDQFACDAFIV